MDCYIVYFWIGLFYLVDRTHQQFVNIAKGKSATISTRYNDNYFAPGKAVDGDNSTDPLNCALSASNQKEAWLQVDLGEKKNIASISFIHGGLGQNVRPISSQVSGIRADADGNGIVYLSNSRTGICSDIFSAATARVICLIWGFLPEGARISVGFPSNDIWNQNPRCQGNEVNIDQCPREQTSCSRNIVLSVYCKSRGVSTLAGFSVYVSDTQNWTSGTICYQHDIQQIPNNNINIDCVTSGRYVTIYNSRNKTSYRSVSENAYINICEINVQGCEYGFYGENCTRCPENCLNNSCHFQIGHCFACEDGYTGEMCESECAAGFYGQGCSLKCGQCRDGAACNNVNGSCADGCSAGRRGEKCDLDCEYGYFGYNCNNTCYLPNCQNSTSCDAKTGGCLASCVKGWAGKTCNVCAETYYGLWCNLTCSNNCLDNVCNLTNGHCLACPEYREGTFCESRKDTTTTSLGSSLHYTQIRKEQGVLSCYDNTILKACAETYHGLSCNLSCSEYCKDSLCDPVTGYCDTCIDQRSGDFCENDISVNGQAADASRENNDHLIAVYVLAATLVITMVSFILYCIKRNHRSINCNSPESEYQNAVITDENNEYSQLEMKKESVSANNETAHYMDISTIEVTSNTEYINAGF